MNSFALGWWLRLKIICGLSKMKTEFSVIMKPVMHKLFDLSLSILVVSGVRLSAFSRSMSLFSREGDALEYISFGSLNSWSTFPLPNGHQRF